MSVDPACLVLKHPIPGTLHQFLKFLGLKETRCPCKDHLLGSSTRRLDSPDSSTSPRVKLLPIPAEESSAKKEEKDPGKKQKIRTMFTQTQMSVLNDRLQRQQSVSSRCKNFPISWNLATNRWGPGSRTRKTTDQETVTLWLRAQQPQNSWLSLPGPGLLGDLFWKPAYTEWTDLGYPTWEQPELEQLVLKQPPQKESELESPSLEEPDLEQSVQQTCQGIPATPDPGPAKLTCQQFGRHFRDCWRKL